MINGGSVRIEYFLSRFSERIEFSMKQRYRHLLRTSPIVVVLLVVTLVVACGTSTTDTQKKTEGFLTTRPAQLRALASEVKIQPILTSGDTLPNGYTMAAIPDGLGAFDNGDGTFTVLMNHELTKIDNLGDARISKLIIDKKTLSVKEGSYLINGTEGFRRFCSATMVGSREGFKDNLFLTGEEATDSTHGGVAIALDPKTGKYTELPWLGHLAHENIMALPGLNKIVTLTTDDAAPGFLYMYVANTQDDFLAGKGQLYVFVADAGKTPADISKTKTTMGKFVAVSQEENKDAKTLSAAVQAKGAMAFTRLEDIAYDLNSSKVD